jgi:hypothetical protein
MPWRYQQSTGYLYYDDKLITKNGYSGHGTGKNAPAMEGIHDVGPIPRGKYTLSKAFDHKIRGPLVMSLTPLGHDARKRSGFLIHGDSREHPGNASNGCIVLDLNHRKMISESEDQILEVYP